MRAKPLPGATKRGGESLVSCHQQEARAAGQTISYRLKILKYGFGRGSVYPVNDE